MKRFFAFITHPLMLSAIGLLALGLLIWFVGPQIKFGEHNRAPLGSERARLLSIIVLLAIWGLHNFWMHYRGVRANRALVAGLHDDAEPSAAQDPNMSESERAQISAQFERAINTLKRYKFKGARGSKALYQLPWYVIIGPPGSGKTTALINSGLEFPLAKETGGHAVQGIGGTRNCDWWFTNEAVLIDTAGRYTTQDSHRVQDGGAWQGFLDLLKRHRRRRPINGAIVAISLQDLLTQTEHERKQHARAVRERLDELMSKLNIRFPVYVVLTKTDLVSGFTEFFAEFSRDEREQVWGVSLPASTKDDCVQAVQLVAGELEQLTQRLYTRLFARLHQERDGRRRTAIAAFPQQFENAQAQAVSFVQQVFALDHYKQQPLLRGVYFTSGVQDGTAVDRLMSAVSGNFGFGRQLNHSAESSGKSFFLTQLFREVIFPEADLVGSNPVYERTAVWLRRASYAAMALLTVGLGVFWSGELVRHQSYLSAVSAEVQNYRSQPAGAEQPAEATLLALPALDALAQAAQIGEHLKPTAAWRFGLSDPRVDDSAIAAYRQQLRERLLPQLVSTLGQAVERSQDSLLYDNFRVYMMLGKPEYLSPERVSDWFDEHWQSAWALEADTRSRLAFHLDNLLKLPLQPQVLDTDLVQDTRDRLLAEPTAQRVYSRLRAHPMYSRRVDMLSQFGNNARRAFRLDAEARARLQVPLLFTKEGYDHVDLSARSPLLADLLSETWVLVDAGTPEETLVDMSEVPAQVEALYMADYIRVWSDLYRQLGVVEFTSLQHGKDILAALADPAYSPLVAVLRVGRNNTQLRPPKDQLEALAAKAPPRGGRAAKLAVGAALNQYEGTPVDNRFADLNGLFGDSGGVGTVLDQIGQLHAYLADITFAPEPPQQAFEEARKRFSGGGGNAITALQSFASTAPEPLRGWLDDLARQSWKVVLGAARRHAADEWRESVYLPYSRTLQGRYPLNRNATDEATLYAFSEFFKPGGTLDQYYQDYMAPFVQARGGWRNRVVDHYSLGFSGEFLEQMRRAQSIKDSLYLESPDTISLTMQLRPKTMDARDARFHLDIGGERLSYNHGPKFWQTLKWRADQENMRVRIAFEDVGGTQYDRSFFGPWAWFRMLDASYVEKTAQSATYLLTFLASASGGESDPHKIIYEVKANSIDNPLRRDLLSGYHCPESI